MNNIAKILILMTIKYRQSIIYDVKRWKETLILKEENESRNSSRWIGH